MFSLQYLFTKNTPVCHIFFIIINQRERKKKQKQIT